MNNGPQLITTEQLMGMYLKGTFGALIMLLCGICGIYLLVLAAATRRKIYLVSGCGWCALAAGVFLLRTFLPTFLGDGNAH